MRGCRKRSSADLLMVWVAAEKGKKLGESECYESFDL